MRVCRGHVRADHRTQDQPVHFAHHCSQGAFGWKYLFIFIIITWLNNYILLYIIIIIIIVVAVNNVITLSCWCFYKKYSSIYLWIFSPAAKTLARRVFPRAPSRRCPRLPTSCNSIASWCQKANKWWDFTSHFCTYKLYINYFIIDRYLDVNDSKNLITIHVQSPTRSSSTFSSMLLSKFFFIYDFEHHPNIWPNKVKLWRDVSLDRHDWTREVIAYEWGCCLQI